MPRLSRTDELVAHVIATIAYVAHAFEVALHLADQVDDPLDDTDSCVLLDQIDAAGCHLADVVWALHPQWRTMSERDAQSHALTLFRKHRPEIDEDACGELAAVDALGRAMDAATAGAAAARSFGPQRRYRDVAASLDDAFDHLEIALYLLDPEAFRVAVDASTPTQRVLLASRLETLELAIEEHRSMLREGAAHRMGAEMN